MKTQLTGIRVVAPLAQQSATVVAGTENRVVAIWGADTESRANYSFRSNPLAEGFCDCTVEDFER
jgi:hypothetical protein